MSTRPFLILLLSLLLLAHSAIGLRTRFQSIDAKALRVITPSQQGSAHEDCFTQGLVFHKDYLIESCGLFGKSRVQKVDPATGVSLLSRSLPPDIFAEGLVVVGRFAYMLTWKNEIIYIFDVASLDIVKTIPLISSTREGWGLTFDGQHLVVSDGSHVLTYLAIR